MQNTRGLEGVQERSHSAGWNLPPPTLLDLSCFGLQEQAWGPSSPRSPPPLGGQGPPGTPPGSVLLGKV